MLLYKEFGKLNEAYPDCLKNYFLKMIDDIVKLWASVLNKKEGTQCAVNIFKKVIREM